MTINSEDNDNFHLEGNFHFFVIDNQDIFDVKGEIEPNFFTNYNKGIFVNLAF